MSLHTRTKQVIAGAITITGVVVFAFTFFRATISPAPDKAPIALAQPPEQSPTDPTGIVLADSPLPAVPKATPKPTPVPGNYPATLLIPKIGVNAKVQYVGVTWRGTMGVPSNFTDVAWYEPGVLPGKTGTAVIDGHVNNGLGLQGVFARLSYVAVGDEVDVVTKEGATLRFAVTRIDSYPYNDPQTAVALFASSDVPTLRLVTCEGNWVKGDKTYDERLVVSAELMQ